MRSTYEFIKANRGTFSVQAMCSVLGVASSGYDEWLTHPISNRAQEDARLLRQIRASFAASHGIYGAPHFKTPAGRVSSCKVCRFLAHRR